MNFKIDNPLLRMKLDFAAFDWRRSGPREKRTGKFTTDRQPIQPRFSGQRLSPDFCEGGRPRTKGGK